DVPVKILSSHLLVASVFLTLPDLGRLADLFVLNRRTAPAEDRRLFRGVRLHRAGLVLGWLFLLVYAAFSTVVLPLQVSPVLARLAPAEAVAGGWNVEEFEVGGEVRRPLLTDEVRWRRVFFSDYGTAGIQRMNDASKVYVVGSAAGAGTLTLTDPQDPARQ